MTYITCHPELVSGSQKTAPSPAFQAPSPVGRGRKAAFTLAEVLITLGIIGVVSAMTMPTLMAKYQKQVTVNKLKKAYAEIAQAVQLSEAEYGTANTWDYESQPGDDLDQKSRYLIQNYIINRLKTSKICNKEEIDICLPNPVSNLKQTGGVNLSNSVFYVITSSGYGILFHAGAVNKNSTAGEEYSPHIHMLVDVDGPYKGENTEGKDNFRLTLNMGKQKATSFEPRDKKSGLVMFGSGWMPPLTREELIDDSNYGCNKNSTGKFCGALIQADGWEIKDDYPW